MPSPHTPMPRISVRRRMRCFVPACVALLKGFLLGNRIILEILCPTTSWVKLDNNPAVKLRPAHRTSRRIVDASRQSLGAPEFLGKIAHMNDNRFILGSQTHVCVCMCLCRFFLRMLSCSRKLEIYGLLKKQQQVPPVPDCKAQLGPN